MPPLINATPPRADPQEVYAVIVAAASQDPATVKRSSDRLKELVEHAGTFDALSEVAAQRDVPIVVRQQAIIQLKNTSLSHWRSRKLLNDEERARMRARCIALLDERDETIAACNKFIIGKLARQDYPHNWSNLLPDLIATIQAHISSRYQSQSSTLASFIHLRRSLEALNYILKEFTSVKMLAGIKTMAQIANDIHATLYSIYTALFSPSSGSTLASLSPITLADPQTSQRAAEDLLIAHLVWKCLVKIGVWVWPKLKPGHRERESIAALEGWFNALFQNSVSHLQTLYTLRLSLLVELTSSPPNPTSTFSPNIPSLAHLSSAASKCLEIVTKHVYLFGKWFRRVQQLDVARFVATPGAGDIVVYMWNQGVVGAADSDSGSADSDEEETSVMLYPTKFVVQAMVLFKESLAQWTPVRKDGTPNEHVLSPEFVSNAVRLLVTRYIPLKPQDLEGWISDPEEWFAGEEREEELWEFEVRPCAERVLMTLCTQYPTHVIPLLLTTFTQLVPNPGSAVQVTVNEALESVLQREALYCAIGRCCTRLKEVLNFGEWIGGGLIREVRSQDPNHAIIKRRIAWLLGKWIASQCYTPNDPRIWEILVALIQPQGDEKQGGAEQTEGVVRLTAAAAVRECVDTVEFSLDCFAPYLPPIISSLVHLLGTAEALESRRRVAGILGVVVERAGNLIVPLVGMVAQPIPELWTLAGDNWTFKGVLLDTASKLVEASGEDSAVLIPLVVPLVRESLDTPARQFLDDDALTLWLSAMQNAPNGALASPNGLIEIFPISIRLLAENLDLLGRIVSIVEGYILLDAPRVLETYALDLFSALERGMTQAISTNVKDMTIMLALVIQLASGYPQLWAEPLHVSGLFVWLVKQLQEDKAQTLLLTEFVYIFARVAVADRNVFCTLVSATAGVTGKEEKFIWEPILDQWWTRFDNMSEPRYRKLAAMGIASLVATGKHDVLDRLPSEICNLWLDVFCELREAQRALEEDGDQPTLFLYWDRAPPTYFREVPELSAEYKRRQVAYETDYVRTTPLGEYVAQRLGEAEGAVGGSGVLVERYLGKADENVVRQIRDELSVRVGGGGGTAGNGNGSGQGDWMIA